MNSPYILQLLWLLLLINGICNNSVAQNKYYTKLQVIESEGKKDILQMAADLDLLSEELHSFQPEEVCYYDYLKLYASNYKGNYQDSIENLQQFLTSCRDNNSIIRGKKHLANLQVISGDYENAIINLNDAIDLTSKTSDMNLLTQVYSVASIVYRLMHQDELSLKYAELLINGGYSDEFVCYGGVNKMRVLLRQNQLVDELEIDKYNDVCLAAGLDIVRLFLKLDWYRYFVIMKADDRLLQKGLNDLINLEPLISRTQFKNIQVYYEAVLAQFYMKIGRVREAELTAQSVLEKNGSIGHSEQLLLALEVLIDLNVKESNQIDSYRYLVQKSAVEKMMYEARLAKQMSFFRVKHNSLAQELKIEQLNKNNQVLELRNRLAAETSQKQQLLMLLVLAGLLLLGFWTYRIKRRHDYFKDVAEIDHLTQVFTRKAFEEKMKLMLDGYQLKDKPVNLGIMDLDHFKSVNDRFGHLVGDWVLKQVILTCEEAANQDVLIARLGGEEFCIVSPVITQLEMMHLMERMRNAVEQMDCSGSGADFNITASFGLSSTVRSGYQLSMLLTHADVALFEAKKNGRNRVVVFDEINPPNAAQAVE